jgi:hypothetical protein
MRGRCQERERSNGFGSVRKSYVDGLLICRPESIMIAKEPIIEYCGTVPLKVHFRDRRFELCAATCSEAR